MPETLLSLSLYLWYVDRCWCVHLPIEAARQHQVLREVDKEDERDCDHRAERNAARWLLQLAYKCSSSCVCVCV